MAKPLLLCILDGIGLNPNNESNAVALANTPTLDNLFENYPHTTLITYGKRVGLPEGQMGNSEVGHLNIGAGRVVKQWLLRIGEAFSSDAVGTLAPFKNFIDRAGDRIHLVGLYSFGGVHSDAEHMFSLVDLIEKMAPEQELVLHLITDGRDTAPKQFEEDLKIIRERLGSKVRIASLSGRYYAMDRDKRFKRTEETFKAMIGDPDTMKIDNIEDYLAEQYKKEVTDEFVQPVRIEDYPIRASDSVLFWNFRSDRMRQLVERLINNGLDQEQMLSFTQYDETFNIPVLFPTEEITNHLGKVLAENNLSQLRIAETEKYPHVTYFFSGGEEEEVINEDRILVPSPRDVKTYDEKPEMSAYEVTDKLLEALKTEKYDLIVLNFANGDMVGHTGDLKAATKAVEVVDQCLGKILKSIQEKNGAALIIADHGNAEQMINYDTGEPHTAHTTYPVPAILFSQQYQSAELREDGALCDVAPTLLQLLKIPKPAEMTGTPLLSKKSQTP